MIITRIAMMAMYLLEARIRIPHQIEHQLIMVSAWRALLSS
jgi:hypothetical protein